LEICTKNAFLIDKCLILRVKHFQLEYPWNQRSESSTPSDLFLQDNYWEQGAIRERNKHCETFQRSIKKVLTPLPLGRPQFRDISRVF